MLLGLFFPKAAFPIIMVVVLGATLVPVVYSYIIWRQIEKQTGA